MKRLLTIFLVIWVSMATAQLEISTIKREEAILNDADTSWNVYHVDEKTTFFQFNQELSELQLRAIDETAHFCILNWDYVEEEQKYTMKVVNDPGVEFEMIIDGPQKQVLLFYWRNQKYLMVRYTIDLIDFKH